MESPSAKRRKLGDPNQGLPSQSSHASAFVEATKELLNDVSLDHDTTFGGAEAILGELEATVRETEPHGPLPIKAAMAALEKKNPIVTPYPGPQIMDDSPYKLSFESPADVQVVGSYQLKTMVTSQSTPAIDMMVVMPPTLFQEKDYLDFRYFHRRSYYLAVIAASVRRSHGDAVYTRFDYLHGNELLPVLVIRPKSALVSEVISNSSEPKTRYEIRVIPCAPDSIFPWSKLVPSRCCIRYTTEQTEGSLSTPTPFYNATLQAESLRCQYGQLLGRTSRSQPSFRDACILGRIWLQQRGFGSDVADGGFGNFEWAILMALLLRGGGRKGEPVLSASLSAIQLFKATVQFLAVTNLPKGSVVIGSKSSTVCKLPQHDAVVYDVKRNFNVLWKVSAWSAELLSHHARWSLTGLRDSSLDQFDPLFIVKADQPLQMFDLLLEVSPPARSLETVPVDSRGPAWDFGDRVQKLMKEGLGEGSQLVSVTIPKTSRCLWPVDSTPPKHTSTTVLVGIVLDPSKPYRRVQKGPSLEQQEEAARFREFWGEAAHPRQFQDGSTLACLAWSDSDSIPKQIICYLARTHLSLTDNDIRFVDTNFSAITDYIGLNPDPFTAARKAFEVLEQDIRDLDDLPLYVRQVTATSPGLRYASIKAPSTQKRGRTPMDVVVMFEASGKWPADLAAIQVLKMAFLLKIGSSLEEAKDEIKTDVGFDHAEGETQNLAFLDISYESEYAFRLRLHSSTEESLVKSVVERKTNDRNLNSKVASEARDMWTSFNLLYALLPLHNQIISTYCQRFGPLSTSIRLVKHWFSTHKLSCHFSEEVIELFVLQAFLKPYPWQAPTSATTGFFRTLHLLSRWQWQDEPMIVDTAQSMSAKDQSAMVTTIKKFRAVVDPHLNRWTLLVATTHATSGTAYTHTGPCKVVANQMTKLTRSACDMMKSKGAKLDARVLFQAPLRHYDVIIRLSPRMMAAVIRGDGAKRSRFKNMNEQVQPHPPLLEHPSLMLLRQLNAVYSNALVLFHGGEDDTIITGLWSQQVRRRPFTVNMPYALRPAAGEANVYECDKEAVLAEIARIGGDLVKTVDG